LIKLSEDAKEKIFIAQVTYEYVKNLLFNPAMEKINVIFNQS